LKRTHLSTLGIALAVAALCLRGSASDGVTKIDPEVAVAGVKRFGINLGLRTSWGAEQLISNVVMNPGFEGIVDRSLVAAEPVGPYHFLDQASWLGRQDNFWAGATYQILTGQSAGSGGKIAGSKNIGSLGLPEYTTAEPLPPLAPGDRIALTQVNDIHLPTQWWIPKDSAGLVSVAMEPRPHSKGVRSLRLTPGAEIHSYLDTIGERAGILLPISGSWRLAFWARGRAATSIAVSFQRVGATAWVDRKVPVSSQWERTVIEFEGGEKGATAALDLCFRTTGEVLLDDVDLSRSGEQRSAFRQEVIGALETLHPEYLRDWQGQLGDTLENRLAPPEARRASRYRPGDDAATDFFYSLPEFLDLCRQVQANPWIVAPTTFSDGEWVGLGRYLRSRDALDRFPEIVVEFGNENWNGIFASAGITDSAMHADAATRAFRRLAEGSGGLPIRAAINAQYANPAAVEELGSRLHIPAMIAVAPYYLTELQAAQSPPAALATLFSNDVRGLRTIAAQVAGQQRETAVYEINMHTTGGDAASASRTSIVAGAASAGSLAKNLLDGVSLGIRRQCVYVLSGLDFKLPGPLGYVPIWGVVRDLGPTRRMRPTGLAMAMLNQAVAGDLHKCRAAAQDITVAPFHSASGWSVAIVSSAAEPREVTLQFPATPAAPLPTRHLSLQAPEPLFTNEERERVTIGEDPVTPEGRSIKVHLPAYGFSVLVPKEIR